MIKINGFIPTEHLMQIENSRNQDVENKKKFDNTLKNTLDKLNNQLVSADNMTQSFIKGEDVEIHEMMLAQEEAKMSLQLAVQVRNKFVETIQELSRMQL